MVDSEAITPDKLYEGFTKMYKCIGLETVLVDSGITPKELYNFISIFNVKWLLDPYDTSVTLPTVNELSKIATEYFGFRKVTIYNNGVEISDGHVFGEMFMMRLMHDRYHTVAGVSIPRRDSRGHYVDKSTSRKDGRSLHGDKPSKIDILTMDKILKTCSNESIAILLKEKRSLYGPHDLAKSVGFALEATKIIRDRKDVTDMEDDDEI